MSSLFSDPPFARGTTLLNKEAIELDVNLNPVAGREVVGSVKSFSDVYPGTGLASQRYSNRNVYCIAARYIGTTSLNPGNNGADTGKWYVIDRKGGVGTAFSTAAGATDILQGRLVGVLDEYLTSEVRPNDIVWLVIGGPTQAKKAANVNINDVGVEISSGSTVTLGTQVNRVGYAIGPSGTVTSSSTEASTTGNAATVKISTNISSVGLLVVGNDLSGSGVPTGATISSVAALEISGTTVTATLGIKGVVLSAIPTSTTLTITDSLSGYAGTTLRVNVDCNQF
jgi:hypothetical protein